MQVTQLAAFKERVEAFLVRKGIAAARFGEMACRDRNFVFDLRKGEREFRTSTMEKVDRFIRDNDEAKTAA